MALSFNGKSQSLIATSSNYSSSSATFTGWIQPSVMSNYRDIMSISNSSNISSPPLRIYLNSSGKIVAEINSIYYIIILPVLGKSTLTSSSISTNKWINVALVIDNNVNTIKMYINGKVDTSTSYSGNFYDTGNSMIIGANRTGNSSYNNFFSGQMEDFRYYSRALTDFEIQTINNSLGRDGIQNSLVSRLKMNSGKKGAAISTNILSDYPNTITFTNRNSPVFGDQFLSFLRDK